MKNILFASFFLLTLLAVNAHAQFSHPGVMFNREDLDRMKAMQDVEPWKTSYDALKSKNTASINYQMQGPFETVSRGPNINASQFSNDMNAVHDQAIMWYMTGEDVYINKARSILNAWASTHTKFEGSTPALLSGDDGMLAVIGAEIILHVNQNWAASEVARVKDYFEDVIWKQNITNDIPAPEILGQSNQGASRLKSMLAIAIFLDDEERFDYTIDAFRGDVDDAYCASLERNSLSSGQQAETGRDQPHPLGAIQNYAQVAEIAWKQGVDLYGDLDNRILTMSEYWSKYNLGESVPYQSFAPCRLSFSTGPSETGRGIERPWAPSEMLYAHYVVRKGISAPWTTQYRDTLPGTAWDKKTFFYRPVETTRFTPDQNKTYYIDVPRHNRRLAADGSSEEPYMTSTTTTGNDVEWRFIAKGNGYWHIQRAAGGTRPRLRTDTSELADMEETSSSGTYTYYQFTPGSSTGTHFLTLPDGPSGRERLQVTNEGVIKFVSSSLAGTWESFAISEASNSTGSNVVNITKRNATGFSIDGNNGGDNGQSIYLWSTNQNNPNQQWVEFDRGNGFYSYQKMGTNFCIDGNNGGDNEQNVYIWECGQNNYNQHWQKVSVGGGAYKLIKRNASGYALNGGSGGADAQNVTLYDSSSSSQNLQWFITPLN